MQLFNKASCDGYIHEMQDMQPAQLHDVKPKQGHVHVTLYVSCVFA